jgi:phosphomannomutase
MKKDLMISISGVRGIVGKGLTPEVITKFGLAFGTFSQKGTLVIGRDTRPSGEMVRNGIVSGLLGTGCSIIDLGICPTPTILYAVKKLKADGGITITASHNPNEWNGLKFIGKEGTFLDKKNAEKLLGIYENKGYKTLPWNEIGTIREDGDGIQRHIDALHSLSSVNVKKIKKRKFRVAIDCVNGAGYDAFPQLLDSLGCEVVKVDCVGTGNFKRNPEPLPENLKKLERMVKKTKSDIGFATDADGDRLSIVDDTGTALGEEYSLPLAVRYVLGKKKGSVVINYSSSRMTDFVTEEYGVPLYKAKVGEANVVKKMRDVKAVIGGEGNGGIILPKLHYTRDAMLGIVLILASLTETKKSISQLKDELPAFRIVKKRKKLRGKKTNINFEKLSKKFPKGKRDTRDGLRIDWKDGWVHVRKSGTEPIVRVIAEAGTKRKAEELCRKVLKLL